jgi:hypothetical protein
MGKENVMEKPLILCEGRDTPARLAWFKRRYPIREVRDIYELQLEELFEVTHPRLRHSPHYGEKLREFLEKRLRPRKKLIGNWVYFPWSGVLLHTVTEEEYELLRTNRNQELITREEQQKLRRFVPAVMGLSIGNGLAVALAHQGVGKTMKLADHDALATTNLNRVRVGLPGVGVPKMTLTSREIYEINPYADLMLFPQGVTSQNVSLLMRAPKPDVIFEAIDDFEMKVRIRLAARNAGVPVVMLTNLGDQVLIDVERYDKNRRLPLFHGLIGKTVEQILTRPITEADKQRYAVRIVGKRNVPPRALRSVKQIGKTLVGRPQLMSTVTVASGLSAYLARRLALGEPLESGRKLVKFERVFI